MKRSIDFTTLYDGIVRKPGSTIYNPEIFREAMNYVKTKRDPSPCPCKGVECTDHNKQLLDTIATIKTVYEPAVHPTIVAVSGFGHVSAETYVKHPPRKDESIAPIVPNGGAGKA